MKYLKTKVVNGIIQISSKQNDRKIGEAIKDTDGYYYFLPHDTAGFWTDYMLLEIAAILTEANKEWDSIVQKL